MELPYSTALPQVMDADCGCVDTGSSLSKQEHTVVNVGHPDGPPRLVRAACLPSRGLRAGADYGVTDYLRQGISRL